MWNVWIDAKPLFPFHFFHCGGCQGCTLDWHQRRRHCVICNIDGDAHRHCIFVLFSVNGIRLSPQAVNHVIFLKTCTFAAIWDLGGLFIFLFGSTHALQSNIQLRGHGATLETSGNGFTITSQPTLFFMVILLNTSWRIPLIHIHFCFCTRGIQFPLGHFTGPCPIYCVYMCVCLCLTVVGWPWQLCFFPHFLSSLLPVVVSNCFPFCCPHRWWLLTWTLGGRADLQLQ